MTVKVGRYKRERVLYMKTKSGMTVPQICRNTGLSGYKIRRIIREEKEDDK